MLAGCGGSMIAFGLQATEFARIPADQHAQRIASDFELVVGGNLLRCREVEARLRLVGVGDRRRADLEVLLRLLELLRDRRLVGLHGAQVLDRDEYVEVGLRDAQNQILPRLGKGRLGLHHQQLGLAVLGEILPAEQRLRQVDVVGVAVETVSGAGVGVDAEAIDSGVKAGVIGEGVAGRSNRRQQPGERLRQFLAPGFCIRTRRRVLSVVGQRLAIDLHQVGGTRGHSREDCRQHEAEPAGAESQRHEANSLASRADPASEDEALTLPGRQRRDHGFKEVDRVERLLIGADDKPCVHHRWLADECCQAAADLQLLQKGFG
jgi:hypothetical protein